MSFQQGNIPNDPKASECDNKDKIKFCSFRNSVNYPSLSKKNSEGEQFESSQAESEDCLEYMYERRIGRQYSINYNVFRDEKFNKVIIPYNFQKKKYDIRDKDIEFYENKDYLKDKLHEFNWNPYFNIERTYAPKTLGQKLKIMLPQMIILIILVYIGSIICLFFSFNPMVIYTLYSWMKKAYSSLKMYKFILLEKFKMNEIKKIIEEENNSEICKINKILWNIGQSGYWLEVQKIIY